MTHGAATDAPATASARPRRAPWTLQRRLILTVIGIVSLILVLVATSTSAILGTVLESRLDEQVRTSVERTALLVGQQLREDPTATAAELLARIQSQEGFLLGVETTEGLTAAAVVGNRIVTLSDDQVEEFVAGVTATDAESASSRAVTITGLGSFQVSGVATTSAITVVGLSRAEIVATIGEMLAVTGLLTAGGLILLAAATAWTIRAGLAPLRAVAATATRVARQPLDQGEVSIVERVPDPQADPRTETGRVGAALNTLLDHVDASLDARHRNEERMRRFVADASHELRTPLASIRGYSELSLRALGHGEPEEAAATTHQSLERIQAQSLRMTGIVEDLLLLARLDEGQELVYDSVDLTRMLVDGVGDARAAGADHEWIVDVGEEPVVIAGDGARLHQVVANLLANARVHTPAGTVVNASVALEGDEAVVRVHDDGPGIAAAAQAELFERFARVDRSRARQTGGSGLGLSIARAISRAHGGDITVVSRPGDTTFTVRLPAQARAPERRQ